MRDRRAGSGAPRLRIAPAQVGSSERLTSSPVLQTHPACPTGHPPAPTAFSTLRWAATQVKRTTTAWFLAPWSLTLPSSARRGRVYSYHFHACLTWEVTSRAFRDGALPKIPGSTRIARRWGHRGPGPGALGWGAGQGMEDGPGQTWKGRARLHSGALTPFRCLAATQRSSGKV